MRFSAIIKEKLEQIIAEWETYARTLLPAAKTMSVLALRDHCRGILLAIANDMETDQTTGSAAETPGQLRSPHGSARIISKQT